MSFFAELKRRNVFKVTIAYIVMAWLIMQVADVVLNNIAAPDWLFQSILLLLGIGLLVAVFFAWEFELTPEGLKREKDIDRAQSITHTTGRKLDFIIIGVLVLALGYFTFDKLVLSAARDAALVEATTHSVTSQVRAAPLTGRGDNAFNPERSIAVLPFADMSPNKDQDYFSDGLSEELLNLLARIPELQVAARTSSFSFKGQNLEIPEIAQRLKVAHVLEGSVRTSGNQIRVTAQLIKADDGYHLWSQTFDRNLDNVFAIQDEIAAEVVRQLKVTLLGAVPTATKIDPQAYALFLHGRQLSRQFTLSSLEQANALYEQALAIDPEYASAWVELARNYTNLGQISMPLEEAKALARRATSRALAIDPDNSVATAQKGWWAMTYDSDLVAAAKYYERAMSLDPSNLDIIRNVSTLLLTLGRIDEAVACGESITRRDPLNSAGHDSLAISYISAGRLEDALATYQTVLSLSPGRINAYYRIGQVLLLKNQPEAALAAFVQEVQDEEYRVKGITMAAHSLGREQEFQAGLTELKQRWGTDFPTEVAHVYAWSGDADSAFEWLEKEYAQGGFAGANTDPLLASLHNDPRWQVLMEKAGVSDDQLAAINFNIRLPE